MKKIVFMIVYNDADYVDYSLRSVLGWADKIVVIEGAFEITMKCGMPARSNDGTIDILNDHVKMGNIELFHLNKREHKHHYDFGYQFAISHGADWAVLLDSDEVWTKKAKTIADSFMKKNVDSEVKEMRINEYSFVNDFNTWYHGVYPRIFKCIPGSSFVFDNEVKFSGYGRGEHKVLTLPGRDVYHYGYVRRKKRWRLKQDYMWEKDFNPLNKKYKLEGDSYILPEDIKIFRFSGKHPDIMTKHLFYGKTANEIIYGEIDE